MADGVAGLAYGAHEVQGVEITSLFRFAAAYVPVAMSSGVKVHAVACRGVDGSGQ